MALGAYSIVRYSNNLNDQRINLGVVAWHPIDGLQSKFTPSVDRVQAIDPRVRLTPLRDQLSAIQREIQDQHAGRDTLVELSNWFRHGLEVTDPYPARMHSLLASIEHFYELLVSPVEEIRRASSQRVFEGAVKRALDSAVRQVDPNGVCMDRGRHKINGVSVEIGVYTATKHRKALWRAISLQSVERPDDQVAKAKATALDVETVREITEYRKLRQLVVLQEPKPRAAERLSESIGWLKRVDAEVVSVKGTETLGDVVQSRLARGLEPARGR